jgi:hypothetical protein
MPITLSAIGQEAKMESSDFHLITQVFIAIGTVSVAILAIWGEKIRDCIAGPILDFELHNARGDLTTLQDGRKTIYYHVKIENKRQWAPARRVRILCTAISKKAPDGSFVQEPLIIPLQLTWAFPSFHELLPSVATDDICDLGYLGETTEKFMLSLYIYPNNFRGFISANEAMRVNLIASADNFTSKSPYVLEISWDGKWSSDLDEMRKHLSIKEV